MIERFIEKKRKVCDFKIDMEMNYDGMIEYIKAVKIYPCNKEIGILGFVEGDEGYCRIDFFRVREAEREKGIGRRLLETAIEELRKHGYTEIIVYPKSEPYEGDSYIEPQELYEIYQHLGFCFTEENVDRERCNNEMKLVIVNI